MKRLGLIGGTSWHSTIEYYRYINERVNKHFGDNTNPPLMVYTLNQSLIHKYQIESNWPGIADLIIDAGKRLEKAGAEMLMFCANTPHKVYQEVQEELDIPILHIADATAKEITQRGLTRICFLGTKYSMTEKFIIDRLAQHLIVALTPSKKETIAELHRIIQEELTYGEILPKSKAFVVQEIESLVKAGAEGVVLGCTEFPLMIQDKDLQIPIFNTTQIHAQAGADFVLS